MVFYGTILPPEQSQTTTMHQNQTLTREISSKSGVCRVTTTKCLGLLLILSTILIPGSF